MVLAVAMASHRVMWICNPVADRGGKQDLPNLQVEFLGPDEGLSLLASREYAALVLDCPVPGWTTRGLLEEIQRSDAVAPVLVRDPEATLADAVVMARLGIHQFLMPGEDPSPVLEAIIRKHAEDSTDASERHPWAEFLVGQQFVHVTHELLEGCRPVMLFHGRLPLADRPLRRVDFGRRPTQSHDEGVVHAAGHELVLVVLVLDEQGARGD